MREWRRHASHGLSFGAIVAALLLLQAILEESGLERHHVAWPDVWRSILPISLMASIGGALYSAFRDDSTKRDRPRRALAGARAGVVAGGIVGLLMVGARFLQHGTVGFGVVLGMMLYGAVSGAFVAVINW